jgi:16S rRNA G966 N2-methylase RsmD
VQNNQLYYGDNLEVLRQHIKDESVDLIYLDPPFNSRQDYNVLFAEKDGTRSSSQIMAGIENTHERGQLCICHMLPRFCIPSASSPSNGAARGDTRDVV